MVMKWSENYYHYQCRTTGFSAAAVVKSTFVRQIANVKALLVEKVPHCSSDLNSFDSARVTSKRSSMALATVSIVLLVFSYHRISEDNKRL